MAHVSHARTTRLLLGLAGAALLTGAPAALADPTYPAVPTTIVDGGADQFVTEAAIAVDPADRTTLVYEDAVRGQTSSAGLHAVRVAADGTVGQPQPIKDGSVGFESIDVAADSQGNAIIVWQRSLGNSAYVVEYSRMNTAGNVSDPVRLTDDGKSGGSPRVAIDSLDRAHIVWTEAGRIRTTMLGANGSTTVGAHFLSAAGAQGPQLAVGGDDAVTVAWRLASNGVHIEATRLDPGGGWDQTVRTVASTTFFADLPAVAAGPDGRSTIAWRQRDAQGADLSVRARRLSAEGEPLETKTLTAAGTDHQSPLVEIDGRNRSVVVWATISGAQLKSRRILADGSLEAVRDVTAAGDPSGEHDLAIDSSNRTIVTWLHVDETVRTRRVGNDGVPEGEPATLSAIEADSPVVAIASGDRPVHAWQRDANPNGTVDDDVDDRIEMIVGATTLDPDEGDPGDGDPTDVPPPDPGPGPADPTPGPGPAPPGPPGPAPPPVVEPTPSAPTGQATVRGSRRAGKPLALRVISTADGFVTVSATQLVTFRNGRAGAAAQKKTVRLKLRRVRRSVRAGQPVTVVLRPTSRKQAAAVARAVKRGRATATAVVKLVFRDASGRESTETLRLKLR